jgi:hypothetical protein
MLNRDSCNAQEATQEQVDLVSGFQKLFFFVADDEAK